MRKERFSQFFQEEGIIYVFLRKKFLVFMMILASIFVSAKSNPNASEFQQIVVTGTVTDQQGVAIAGVTVMVKGTTNGTLSDILGKYTLSNVPSNATLSFTFIGMAPQEVPLGGQTRINVVMKEATLTLEEVVVIGYGVQKKESIVGAIAQTTNEQLKKSGNVTDLKQAITGQLPGVVTITGSGEPGGVRRGESATAIYIRGQNTWNGGQALVLVDGIERSMEDLDVSEVENISILKDASATAVFGVKGANGVILITTKRGILGKPKLSFTYNATALSVSRVPTKLNSYDAIMMRNESIERETPLNEPSWADYIPYKMAKHFQQPQSAADAYIFPDVNWEKAMFDDYAMSHRAALNLQGGTGFVNYFSSLAYLKESDMLKFYDSGLGYHPNYDFNRFNFRNNFDFNVTKTTVVKVNLSGYYSQKNTIYGYHQRIAGTNQVVWGSLWTMPPDAYLPQYPDGRFGTSEKLPFEQLPNPITFNLANGTEQLRTVQLNADFALEQKLDFITKGLKASASLYYDNSVESTYGINSAGWGTNVAGAPLQKQIRWDYYTGPNQNPAEYTIDYPIEGTNQFDYAKLSYFGIRPEVITANTNALYPGQWSNIPVVRRMLYQGQLTYARKFGLHNVGAMALVKREEYADGSEFKHFREDWVFRATYDYDTRYLLEVNGAYNGSETFGPGYRFDFFPSLAVGWLVTNEKFFKVDFINKLKLRYSIGKVGDDKISGESRWLYSTQYSYGGQSRLIASASGLST
jgi:TonB-linked SusC/RagA family outer membrane protein